MTKQAQWKSQSRQEISRLVAAHSRSPLSPAGAIALRFIDAPIETVPRDARFALISEASGFLTGLTAPAARESLLKGVGLEMQYMVAKEGATEKPPKPLVARPTGNFLAILRDREKLESTMKDKDQNSLAEVAITHIVGQEKKMMAMRVKPMVAQYLEARKIPVEEHPLTAAISVYLGYNYTWHQDEKINLYKMEMLYLNAMKEDRRLRFEQATAANKLAKRICGKQGFTTRQKLSVRKFVSGQLENLKDDSAIQEQREKFRLQFMGQKRPAAKIAAAPSQPTKLGRKEERIAAHCLEEIESLHNPAIAQAFRSLLDRGMIGTTALNSISKAGPAQQLVFLRAVENPDMPAQIGPNRVDRLAQVIGFIDETRGQHREAAERRFGAEETARLLNFMQTHGLIHNSESGIIHLQRQSY